MQVRSYLTVKMFFRWFPGDWVWKFICQYLYANWATESKTNWRQYDCLL